MSKLTAYFLTLFAVSPLWGAREAVQYRTGWLLDSTGIYFVKTKGVIAKELSFVDKKVPAPAGARGDVDETIVRIVGGVSFNGKYAWLDERHLSYDKAAHKFQYFGPSGEAIWEKDSLYGGEIAQDGERILATEVELRWLKTNEHANSPHPLSLFDSAGKRIQAYSTCMSFMNSFHKIPNNRFTAVHCARSDNDKSGYTLLIDLRSGKTKRIETHVGIEVGEDGTYTIFSSEPAFDPVTKKHGDPIRTKYKAGSFFD